MSLRAEGYKAEYDLVGRGLKAQMKYADKIGAKFCIVLGSNELAAGEAKLKDMESGEEKEIKLGEGFVESFSNELIAKMFSGADFENV